MATTPEIHGHTAAGFEPVREAFVENFARRGEYGAQVCVRHRGEVVVDLWAGLADVAAKRAFEADTLGLVFSTTKGMAALCFLMLADRGQLDYDAPVARYWPEFAQGGKGEISVRTLLNHRSGLVGIDAPITLDDLEGPPEKVDAILAAQAPRWAPGTDQGYHGVTFGLYAAALFRRIAGETIGVFFAREVAGPLGADVFIGLPEALESRVAVNYPATTFERVFKIVPKLLAHPGLEGRVYRQVALGRDAAKAFANPRELGPMGLDNLNLRRVRALELPWMNAMASARGLARVYGALAEGGTVPGKDGQPVTLVRPEALEPLGQRQSWVAMDRVLRKPVGWSQGFLKEEERMFSPEPTSFGHPGAGGALGWCDPKNHLAIGYVMNKMGHHIRSPRALALSHATYRCIAGR